MRKPRPIQIQDSVNEAGKKGKHAQEAAKANDLTTSRRSLKPSINSRREAEEMLNFAETQEEIAEDLSKPSELA